jgi:hypothetical protein
MKILFWIRSHLTICVVLAIVVVTLSGLIAWINSPKSIPLRYSPTIFTGHYRGNEIIGQKFFKVVCNEGNLGYWEVEINEPGWNRYRGYYPNGILSQEGEINVPFGDNPPEPQPDHSDVKWGKYYKPDGTLSSEIQNGTGEQILWFPNGNIRWKMVLKDYKRVKVEMWAEDGKLITQETY